MNKQARIDPWPCWLGTICDCLSLAIPALKVTQPDLSSLACCVAARALHVGEEEAKGRMVAPTTVSEYLVEVD
jgi:hypothetical protein